MPHTDGPDDPGRPLRTLLLLLCLSLRVGGEPTHVGCVNLPKGNSTSDLWFQVSSSNPLVCVSTCAQHAFKYGAVGSSTCLCGSGYGSSGSSPDCALCSALSSLLCGSDTSLAVYDTKVSAPSAPSSLKLMQKTEDALKIEWKAPIAPNGLRGYRVVAKPLFTYSQEGVQARQWEFMEPFITQTYLVSLTPGTKYEVKLTALGSSGESSPVEEVMWTKIGIPDAPRPPRILWEEGGRMAVALEGVTNSKGPVTLYRLAMIDEDQLGFFNKDGRVGYKEGKDLGYPYYTAAEWGPEGLPSHFIIGNGDMVGGLLNGPIPTQKGHWHPALGVVSSHENLTRIHYSTTGHEQHANIQRQTQDKEVPGEVIVEETDGVVVALWIAIGIASFILLLCVGFFLLIKYNKLPGKSSRRAPARRESHQLSQTTSTFPLSTSNSNNGLAYEEFEACGGYTHLAFVPEDEDWGRKVVLALSSVSCVPRAEVPLPEDQDSGSGAAISLVAQGRWGPVYKSIRNSANNSSNTGQHLLLYELPPPSIKSGSGSGSSSSGWDEEMYLALEAVLRPTRHPNVAFISGFLTSHTSTISRFYLTLDCGPGGELSLKKALLHLRTLPSVEGMEKQLLLCAMGVAEGLFHLHSFKLLHGELSSWSIVLDSPEEWTRPKLTGFGLLSSNPLKKERDRSRWMAVEKLHSRCIPPSDSWSFGVLLWEIATLGGTPLAEVRPEDVKRRVERGTRPGQGENVGDGLYQLMLTCWQLDRDERPDAGSLACSVHQLLPSAKEELGLWDKFKWPPYIEAFEFPPTK